MHKYTVEWSTVPSPAFTYYNGTRTISANSEDEAMEKVQKKIAIELNRRTSNIKIKNCIREK